jgi:hypothetical protein
MSLLCCETILYCAERLYIQPRELPVLPVPAWHRSRYGELSVIYRSWMIDRFHQIRRSACPPVRLPVAFVYDCNLGISTSNKSNQNSANFYEPQKPLCNT